MTIDSTITVGVVVALISTALSTTITLWITRENKKKALLDQLDGILKLAFQYPYLESSRFTESWVPNFPEDDEKFLRYDVYCTMLFNFLSGVADHYRYDKSKIEKFIAIKDWVRLHGLCWKNPKSSYENVDSYDKKFVELMNSYLK